MNRNEKHIFIYIGEHPSYIKFVFLHHVFTSSKKYSSEKIIKMKAATTHIIIYLVNRGLREMLLPCYHPPISGLSSLFSSCRIFGSPRRLLFGKNLFYVEILFIFFLPLYFSFIYCQLCRLNREKINRLYFG